MTRGLILLATFLVLVATLVLAWQFRFERDPNFPVYRLADLRERALATPGAEWTGDALAPKLKLQVSAANPRVIVRLGFPEMDGVSFLHLRYRIAASQLQVGREIWDDGRFMIEWRPIETKGWESDYFTSIRGSRVSELAECVMRPENGPAVPTLRVEHLGSSGDLELLQFEASPLRERWSWIYGSWLLVIGWIAWVVAWIRWMGVASWWRPLMAAAICTVMGIYFVIPGPWKILNSIGGPFQIGPELQKVEKSEIPLASPHSAGIPLPNAGEKLESLGKLPDKGDLTLRIKLYAKHARPLLHAVMLFGPALWVACLIGFGRSAALMGAFSVGVETAQLGFGYGFDWIDVLDLLWNTLGIVSAWLVYRKLPKWLPPSLARWIH